MLSISIKRGMSIYPYVVDDVMPMGKGGMSQILIGHENNKKKKIAIKISKGVESSYEEALRSEAMILQKLNHPNIVRILPSPIQSKYAMPMIRAMEIKGNPWYFAMEYLEGLPLSAYVRGSKGLPEGIALTILEKIATALDYIHKNLITHLDMKTENIVMRYPLKRGQTN